MPKHLAAVATIVVALGAVAVTPSSPPALDHDGEEIVVRPDGNIDDAHRPDSSAADWVTYADHVVVATVIDDRDERPIHENSGSGWYDRRVTLKVDELLWSHSEAKRAVPTTFAHPAWGFTFTDGDPTKRAKWAIDGPVIGTGGRTASSGGVSGSPGRR